MPSQPEPTRDTDEALLLAIAPQQDVASGIETRLRDAGRNARVDWLDKPEALGTYLKEHDPVLFCCRTAAGGGNALKRLLGLCLNADPGTPVVLIEDVDRPSHAELMRAGARDVVSPDDPEHLTAVLVRELDVARLRSETDRHRHRAAQLERRLETMLAESREARAALQEGIHARLNSTYARLFGYDSPGELEGVPLMDLVASSDRERVKKKLTDCGKGKDDGEPLRFTGQRADGSRREVTTHFRTVQTDGETEVEVLIPQPAPDNVGGRDEARKALYYALARVDADDGVAGLCFLTVDDLDGLRERQGLSNAERVADELALFLLDAVRDGDRCFRFGAGEFVVLCPRRSEHDLHTSAEELRAAIDAEVFGDEDAAASVTVSIATAALDPGADREALLLKAMRRARQTSDAGGNTVVPAAESERRPSGEAAEQERLNLLRLGLREDRFTFAYQSIASLEGGDTEHFDVLLRLVGEQGELLYPRDFIEIARRHGLMRDIDRLVVRKILELQAQRRERGADGIFFVRLSDATLDEAPAFLEWLCERVDELHSDFGELGFGLTEDSLRSNVRRAQQLAEGLRKLGFSLTIENFGSTGKSTQLLERITADFVKLDAAVTEALAGDESDPRIVEAVQAARKRNISLIAQQVADANTMARLWQIGINYIQGRFVQEPDAETVAGINAA